jgi:AcrR family transcriptional regulator
VALENSRRSLRRADAGPRKGDRREAEILDATEQLLATHAFTELTIDDIAHQAGLSRSAVYFYFSSKEAVLGALHERMYGQMAEVTMPLLAADHVSRDVMRAAIEGVARNWRVHTHALRTFHETANALPDFGAQWRARLDRHVLALTELIEDERRAGRAATGAPSARAIASAWFWMLEQQFYELFRRKHTRAEEADLVEALTVLWGRAIGAGDHY